MNSNRPRPRLLQTLSLALAATLVLLCVVRPARACGPFSLEAIFVHSVHPDFPLERFARGQIGVLQPTYARSYLVAAYRHLSGAGLNAEEQGALVSLWRERLDISTERDAVEPASKLWLEARKRVPGIAPLETVEYWRTAGEYDYFLNCPDDAFRNAAATLDERVRKYGAEHASVKLWVEAQDTVFSNCGKGELIPAPLGADADALARADRAYQIAAANFYATRYDEARTAFEQIARDASSPWRASAPYLAARAMLRKGSMAEGEARTAALAQAEQLFQKVLDERSLSASHAGARKLLGLTRLRLRPDVRLRELSQAVLRKNAQASLKQDVWDLTAILDKLVGEETTPAELKFKTLPQAAREDDLANWVLTFQTGDADALAHSLQLFERTRSLPWLVAALTKLDGSDARTPALLAAAANVGTDSAAFPTVAFHTARLLAEAGREEQARGRLDAWLAQSRASLPPSALNQLLRQRTLLARNLEEFLTFAQRVPTGFSYNEDGRELLIDAGELAKDETYKERASGRALFDADAARLMNNHFPLGLLRQAANSRTLPAHLRREVAVAAWTRSALLGDREAGRELAPVLEALAPELKGFLNDETGAATDEQRRFSALYAILKFPGLRPHVDSGVGRTTPLKNIDNYRDNWWCVHDKPAQADAAKTAAAKASPQSFLNERQRLLASGEESRINSLGTAPNFLTRLAIEWATKAPGDPRVPEALHLAVRSTRYGCTDEQTTALSRSAFNLLHKRYPQSEWAKKTPYWFKHGG